LLRLGTRVLGASIRPAEINGGPGALLLDGDQRVIAVWALEFDGDRIERISSIINPDKLGHLGPLADVNALLRQAAQR
jgi:RNA polymerase sigma-70 factor, ECF subfamily